MEESPYKHNPLRDLLGKDGAMEGMRVETYEHPKELWQTLDAWIDCVGSSQQFLVETGLDSHISTNDLMQLIAGEARLGKYLSHYLALCLPHKTIRPRVFLNQCTNAYVKARPSMPTVELPKELYARLYRDYVNRLLARVRTKEMTPSWSGSSVFYQELQVLVTDFLARKQISPTEESITAVMTNIARGIDESVSLEMLQGYAPLPDELSEQGVCMRIAQLPIFNDPEIKTHIVSLARRHFQLSKSHQPISPRTLMLHLRECSPGTSSAPQYVTQERFAEVSDLSGNVLSRMKRGKASLETLHTVITHLNLNETQQKILTELLDKNSTLSRESLRSLTALQQHYGPDTLEKLTIDTEGSRAQERARRGRQQRARKIQMIGWGQESEALQAEYAAKLQQLELENTLAGKALRTAAFNDLIHIPLGDNSMYRFLNLYCAAYKYTLESLSAKLDIEPLSVKRYFLRRRDGRVLSLPLGNNFNSLYGQIEKDAGEGAAQIFIALYVKEVRGESQRLPPPWWRYQLDTVNGTIKDNVPQWVTLLEVENVPPIETKRQYIQAVRAFLGESVSHMAELFGVTETQLAMFLARNTNHSLSDSQDAITAALAKLCEGITPSIFVNGIYSQLPIREEKIHQAAVQQENQEEAMNGLRALSVDANTVHEFMWLFCAAFGYTYATLSQETSVPEASLKGYFTPNDTGLTTKRVPNHDNFRALYELVRRDAGEHSGQLFIALCVKEASPRDSTHFPPVWWRWRLDVVNNLTNTEDVPEWVRLVGGKERIDHIVTKREYVLAIRQFLSMTNEKMAPLLGLTRNQLRDFLWPTKGTTLQDYQEQFAVKLAELCQGIDPPLFIASVFKPLPINETLAGKHDAKSAEQEQALTKLNEPPQREETLADFFFDVLHVVGVEQAQLEQEIGLPPQAITNNILHKNKTPTGENYKKIKSWLTTHQEELLQKTTEDPAVKENIRIDEKFTWLCIRESKKSKQPILSLPPEYFLYAVYKTNNSSLSQLEYVPAYRDEIDTITARGTYIQAIRKAWGIQTANELGVQLGFSEGFMRQFESNSPKFPEKKHRDQIVQKMLEYQKKVMRQGLPMLFDKDIYESDSLWTS